MLKASKAPLANLGTLVPFGVSVARSRLGLLETPALTWAPQPLRPAADAVEKAAALFSDGVRTVLMTYGKRIADPSAQLVVERVADAAIELTVATAALARATKSYLANSATAPHEVALANVLGQESAARAAAAVREFTSGKAAAAHKLKFAVADEVCAAGGYMAKHPLGF